VRASRRIGGASARAAEKRSLGVGHAAGLRQQRKTGRVPAFFVVITGKNRKTASAMKYPG